MGDTTDTSTSANKPNNMDLDSMDMDQLLHLAFKMACDKVASNEYGTNVPVDIQLQLYGLFSRVNKGRASTAIVNKMSLLDPRTRAKYDAWKKYDELSEEEAMKTYIGIVRMLDDLKEMGKLDEDEDGRPKQGSGMGKSAPQGFSFEQGSDQGNSDHNHDGDNEAPKTITEIMFKCSEDGDENAMYNILKDVNSKKEQYDLANSRDEYGYTMLIRAADRGHAAVIRLLLLYGADPSKGDEEEQQTPLHVACVCKHASVVREIMRYAALSSISVADCVPWAKNEATTPKLADPKQMPRTISAHQQNLLELKDSYGNTPLDYLDTDADRELVDALYYKPNRVVMFYHAVCQSMQSRDPANDQELYTADSAMYFALGVAAIGLTLGILYKWKARES